MKALTIIFAIEFMAATAALGSPFNLSYSGRLADASGRPACGPIDIVVSFYRTEDALTKITGAPSPLFNGVALDEGIFQITFDFTAAEYHTIFNGDDVWVEIADVTKGQTYPRQKFNAVPYALKVPVDGSTVQYNSDGKLVISPSVGVGTITEVVAGAGLTGGGNSGSVTVGLTDVALPGAYTKVTIDSKGRVTSGGTLSSSDIPSLNAEKISDGSISNAEFGYLDNLSGNIQSQLDGKSAATDPRLSDARPPNGNAGGDLAGTYPNPTIKRSATDDTSRAIGADHIKSAAVTTTKVADGAITTAKLDNAAVTRAKLSIDGCASGEVLKSNGTGWVCGADSGFISSIVNIVSDYVVTANDNGKIFVATSPIFITLPDSSTVPSGFQVAVKLAFGGGSLNVKPTGSDPIDGLNLGVLFTGSNDALTFINSGSSWFIPHYYDQSHFLRNNALAVSCGGNGNDCYSSSVAMSYGFGITPSMKLLEYVSNNNGFPVWKEVNGNRILKANGSDTWQMKLNPNGKGHTTTAFEAWNDIVGRVCPPNVYLDDSNKFTSGNCLYYTTENSEALNAAGTSQTVNGSIGLGTADTYSGSRKWYTGNIQTCATKGMRLPTVFETTGTNDSTGNSGSAYPSNDGNPVFAGVSGVPSVTTRTATASGYPVNVAFYWTWDGSGLNVWQYFDNRNIRCVLP